MSATNPKADAYYSSLKKWREESQFLRKILLGCSLTEEFKWNKPCYTFQESNVVILLPLKEYCALLLCKGALLKDPKGILIRPTENTQAARQIRFTDIAEIKKLQGVLTGYIKEAIAAEKAGLEVVYKKISEYKIPGEFQKRLDKNAALEKAFNALTPGRQRMYLLHFSTAKQVQTRESRIDKCTLQILAGKGLTDDYTQRKKQADT